MTRPFIYILLYILLGIVSGQQFCEHKFVALFVIVIIASAIAVSVIKRINVTVLLTVAALIGFAAGHYSLQPRDERLYDIAKYNTNVDITAEVYDFNKEYDNFFRYVIILKQTDSLEPKNSKAIIYTDSDLKAGDIIRFNAMLLPIAKKVNKTDFDSYSYFRSMNIEYKAYPSAVNTIGHTFNINSILKSIRNSFSDKYDCLMPSKEASFVKAVVLGDKACIDEDLYYEFRTAGVAHILAISGLHISILSGIIFLLIGRISRNGAYIITILFLSLYSMLTGLSPSVVRACIMAAVVITGNFLGREYDILSSAAFVCSLLVVINPYYIYNIGFCYSFLCVFGIGIMLDIAKEYDVINMKYGNIIMLLLISFAANIFAKPLTVYSFYYINPYDIITNMLIVPFMSLLLGFSIISGLTSFISLYIGRFFIGLPYVFIKLYEYICGVAVRLPYYTITTGGMKISVLIAIYVLYIIIYCCIMNKKNIKFIVIPVIFFIINSAIAPKPISYIDTDNSKTMIINDNNKCILVNCGSKPFAEYGIYRVLNYLKYLNIKHIDSIYITKSDYYNSGGFLELAQYIDINKIYIYSGCKRNKIYEEIILTAYANNIKIEKVNKADIIYNDISLKKAISLVEKSDM